MDQNDIYQFNSSWPHYKCDRNSTGRSSYLGPYTNFTRWKFNIDSYTSSSPVISSNHTIYFNTDSYYLFAITNSGSTLWTSYIPYSLSSPALSIDNFLYSASNTTLYKLTLQGSNIWTFNMSLIMSSPVLDSNGNIYIGSYNSKIYSISSYGSLNWVYATSGYVVDCIIGPDNTIFTGSSDTYFYALTSYGSLLWKYETHKSINTGGAIGPNDIVYFGSSDSYLYATTYFEGSLVWKFQSNDNIATSPVISAEGQIMFTCFSGALYSIYSNGSMNWQYKLNAVVLGSPALGADGTIYLGNIFGLFAISSTGSLIWKWSESIKTGFGSPAVGPDGTLYIGHGDGLYAFNYPIAIENVPSISPIHSSDNNSSHTFVIVIVVILCSVVLIMTICSLRMHYIRKKIQLDDENYKLIDSDEVKEREDIAKPEPVKPSIFNQIHQYIFPPRSIHEHGIPWNEISLPTYVTTERSPIVGRGTFGIVVHGIWCPTRDIPGESRKRIHVAVKVLNRSDTGISRKNSTDKILKAALEEVKTLLRAEEKMIHKDCIVKVYGIASGRLPRALCATMGVYQGMEAVGIVMRYEGGGSLQALIHKRSKLKPLYIQEKIRILAQIARGLRELHAVGVIHADIKPENVLLSADKPPMIRLADFGLSLLTNQGSLGASSLVQTNHIRGSPIYSAPEILHNPFGSQTQLKVDSKGNTIEMKGQVAKPSRKSDIYSFSLLAWELLSEKLPFSEALNEVMLSMMVHQDQRPPLNCIPAKCPSEVVKMIEACWQTDRSKRLTAAECFAILTREHEILVQDLAASSKNPESDSIQNV